jgi:hypothetical protein
MVCFLFLAMFAGCSEMFDPRDDTDDAGLVASVEVSPALANLQPGNSIRFAATLRDAEGNSLADQAISWTSSYPNVALVDENGLATALSSGTATITASSEAKIGTAALTVSQDQPPPSGLLPAFAGAEGYGALALDGIDRSNQEVLFVTNTNDSGAGSLRQALADSDPNKLSFIIFRTGGTITLRSRLYLEKPYVYIAGQTAPGGGIQLHSPIGIVMFIDTRRGVDHWVVRYLRMRADKVAGGPDVFSARAGTDMVFDHISVSFGNDETFTFNVLSTIHGGTDSRDITLQRSIIGPTLVPHSTNSLIKGADDGTTRTYNFSFHHNLYLHAAARSPRIVAVSTAQVVNNITYNWRSWVGGIEAGEGNNPCSYDFVKNYWKAGPWTGGHSNRLIRHDDNTALCDIHATGNVAEPFQLDPTADQQNLFKYRDTERPLPSSVFTQSRLASPPIPITEHAALDLSSVVLADVGANARLDCDGSWLVAIDGLDGQLIDHVRRGTGPATDPANDHPDDYGGIPTLAEGTACADRDADGMPDAFETRFGFDPNDASDAAQDADGDGYTNLEEYLNGVF